MGDRRLRTSEDDLVECAGWRLRVMNSIPSNTEASSTTLSATGQNRIEWKDITAAETMQKGESDEKSVCIGDGLLHKGVQAGQRSNCLEYWTSRSPKDMICRNDITARERAMIISRRREDWIHLLFRHLFARGQARWHSTLKDCWGFPRIDTELDEMSNGTPVRICNPLCGSLPQNRKRDVTGFLVPAIHQHLYRSHQTCRLPLLHRSLENRPRITN